MTSITTNRTTTKSLPKANSTYRICISNINKPGVLGQIATIIANHNCNIIRQSNRARGDVSLSVIDVSVTSDRMLDEVLSSIVKMNDVVSCNLNHFDHNVSLSTKKETYSRLCIVNENIPGVLGLTGEILGRLSLNIISQQNQSHWEQHLASTIIDLDIDTNDPRLTEAAKQILNIPGVVSADIGMFAPGSLTETRERTPSNSFNNQIPLTSLPLYTDKATSPKKKKSKKMKPPTTPPITPPKITPNIFSPSTSPSIPPSTVPTVTSIPTTSSISSIPPKVATTATLVENAYYEGGDNNNSESFKLRKEQLKVMSRRSASTLDATQLLIVMVGLPARGKSFTARKLCNFLNWGTKTRAKVFNAGKYRRKVQAEEAEAVTKVKKQRGKTLSFSAEADGSASFFSADNKDASSQREKAADLALDDILEWFTKHPSSSSCAIFDATNSTRSRRHHIVGRFSPHSSIRVVFIEVKCDDKAVLNENILHKVRCSPDYYGMSTNDALNDFKERIHNYTLVYDSIDKIKDRHLSYIQLENLGNSAVLNKVYGRMTTLVLPFLMALHVGIRPIWFFCVDENDKDYNISSSSSFKRSSLLFKWLRTAFFMFGSDDVFTKKDNVDDDDNDDEEDNITVLPVFTSSSSISFGTAVQLCDMLLQEDDEREEDVSSGSKTDDVNDDNQQFTIVHKVRDVLRPQSLGKTDRQLCSRLSPMAIELEQQTTPTLVVADSRVICALMSYFLKIPVESISLEHTPSLKNGILELTPSQSGSWQQTMHNLSK